MKITNRFEVPAELNEEAINDQVKFGYSVRDKFAKDISNYLPELKLKGGEGDSVFYEETLFVYSQERIEKINMLLKAIFSDPHASNTRGLCQLVLQELGTDKFN